MKKVLKTILVVIMTATVTTFFACSSSDDENSSGSGSGNGSESQNESKNTSESRLPKSVGENPFAGKKWIFKASDDEEDMGDGYLEFSDTTLEFRDPLKWESETYEYSYDTTKQLIYLERKTFHSRTYEYKQYSNIEDCITSMKELYQQYETEWTLDTEAYYTDVATSYLSQLSAKKYEISGDKLILTEYFIGEIPLDTEADGDGIRIKGGLRWGAKLSYPLFKDGEFHGNVYLDDKDDYKKIGVIKGTYTTSTPGIGSWYVKLKFNSLPEGEKKLKLDTEYTISYTWEPALAPITYTLEK